MTLPLIRQGEGHHDDRDAFTASHTKLIRQGEGLAAYARIQNLLLAASTKPEQIVDTTPDLPTTSTLTRATAGGDERKLRGIPAIARGVPGEIPGSRPDRIR